MLDKIFGYKVHSFLHVLGMSVLAFGLPFNKVLMSIGAIWGVSNLLLEGNFREYAKNSRKNKPFLWLSAFCLLHIIGLIWTSDFSYALHDIKIKLPLLAVPLALVARPITNRNHIHFIFYCLLASLFLTSIINFGYYQQWFGAKKYTDIRQLSLFGSHIRYGILISLGAAICLYFVRFESTRLLRIGWISLFCWFSCYTFYSQILSGALSLFLAVVVFVFVVTLQFNRFIPFVIGGISVLFFFGLSIFLKPTDYQKVDVSKLPSKTKEGHFYKHDISNKNRENNQLVYISYCEEELEREWNKRSTISYYKKDKKGQEVRNTLMRYLTSKNLTKDAEGIRKLSLSDVRHIEDGIASVELLQTGLSARISGIKYQLNNNFDPNGHSILQRFEYWKVGSHIVQQHWLFGVGTGDVQHAFDTQYEKENSTLLPENRLRAHNTYLTVWITFGITGLIVFIGFLISFWRFNFRNKELTPLIFIVVAIATFFIEDTLETQMGVSIISLFVGLFLNKIEPIRRKEGLR